MWILLPIPPVIAQASKAVIEGVVINAATKAPVVGADVTIVGSGDDFKATPEDQVVLQKTDAKGQFILRAPGRGLYFLAIYSPGIMYVFMLGPIVDVDLRPSVPSVISDPRIGAAIATSTDRGGTVHAKLAITISFYAIIDGQVTGPDGRPAPRCAVQVFEEVPSGSDENEDASAIPIPGTRRKVLPASLDDDPPRTDEHGAYRVQLSKGGTYYVREKCRYAGTRPWMTQDRATFYPEALDMQSATPIRLAAGGHARADIRISEAKGFRITGGLLNAPPNASVVVWALFKDGFDDQSIEGGSANGRYTIENLLPGRYIIFATSNDKLRASQRAEVTDRDLEDVNLTLHAPNDLPGR